MKNYYIPRTTFCPCCIFRSHMSYLSKPPDLFLCVLFSIVIRKLIIDLINSLDIVAGEAFIFLRPRRHAYNTDLWHDSSDSKLACSSSSRNRTRRSVTGVDRPNQLKTSSGGASRDQTVSACSATICTHSQSVSQSVLLIQIHAIMWL